MKWTKKGLLYTPEHLSWSTSHAQLPVADPTIRNGVQRIYFSTRNANNQSLPSYVDVDVNHPEKIIDQAIAPLLELGTPGTFDDCGIMPSCILAYNNRLYMYYIGWNVRATIPYHNSIGMAVSHDDGNTWKKMALGPIIDRNATEPFFCGTSCVVKAPNEVLHMYYLSCTEWREVNGKMEPRYHIKHATSFDGTIWNRNGRVAIDYQNEDEAGLVSASVIEHDGKLHMWYAYRGIQDYRTDKATSYRIGYAVSDDGVIWERRDKSSGISLSEEGFDNHMICYPNVVKIENRLRMFYNGNGFGASGIGWAEMPLKDLEA